ncbi:hypothetical protein B0H67DRAFT_660660, partial [Lasiosphaeris hirsuta]
RGIQSGRIRCCRRTSWPGANTASRSRNDPITEFGRQVTSSISQLQFDKPSAIGLPPVFGVRGLLIRRQTLRRIEFPALTGIMASLRGLEKVTIERCRDVIPQPWLIPSQFQEILLCLRAADSLDSLSLFEDHNQLLHGGPTTGRTTFMPIPSSAVQEYQPDWPRLETLAITSEAMRPAAMPDRTDKLLVAAAHAALRMPELQTMEIWNGGKDFACIFRYRRGGEDGGPKRPTITLSVSWQYRLREDAIKAWNEVASHTNRYGLRGMNPPGIIKTQASVMGRLQLRSLVVHPVSLTQLQWEAKNGAWAPLP